MKNAAHVLRFGMLLLLACAMPSPTRAASPSSATAGALRDGQHDFDFMLGKFKLKVRRLKNPLHGSNEWYEMTGTTACRPFWNGKANIEEAELDGPNGHMAGAMVRLYNET